METHKIYVNKFYDQIMPCQIIKFRDGLYVTNGSKL